MKKNFGVSNFGQKGYCVSTVGLDEAKIEKVSLRITICCCNTLFSEGIKQLLEENGLGVNYRITISSQKEAINTKPNILITDFHTLSVLSHDSLLNHNTGILLLWTACLPKLEQERLLEFIFHGLVGILLPADTTFSRLKKALTSIDKGELWFTRKKLKDIISYMKGVGVEVHQPTKREIEIITLICKGYRNKEIMKKLGLTEHSVKKHLNHLYKKAGVSDRLQLALYAIMHWSFHASLGQETNKRRKIDKAR